VAIDYKNEESIGNTYEVDGQESNAKIMTNVDADRFFDLVIERVGSL